MLLQKRTAPDGAWKVAVPLLRDSGGGRLYVSFVRPTWHSAILFGGLASMTREGLTIGGMADDVAFSCLAYGAAAVTALAGGQFVSWYAGSERTSRILSGLLSLAGFGLAGTFGGFSVLPPAVAFAFVLGLTGAGELGYRLGRVGVPEPVGVADEPQPAAGALDGKGQVAGRPRKAPAVRRRGLK
ncbi:hypothetical protein GCM10027290_44930 [Micromonospora sonneratiae]|jgi:hypothetical protein|uniref:Uncharacterized protein n=1 Tax=Micromonospora sonneratiae TaxID=1184706 RepID=A0ABW3Y7H9_9ACTN